MLTLQTLQKFLYVNAGLQGMEGTDPDLEAAIYWYAADHHEGQTSDLYAVLCTSPYSPGPCESSPADDLDNSSNVWYHMIHDEITVNGAEFPS